MNEILQSLNHHLSEIDTNTPFGQVCALGMQALADAQDYDRPDRQERLVQAAESFIEAIVLAEDRPEPLIGMAYLLTILEDFRLADKYAHLALKLAPDYSEVHAVLRLIETCSVVFNTRDDLDRQDLVNRLQMQAMMNEDAEADESVLPPAVLADIDLEELYTRTETLLYIYDQLMKKEPPPQVMTRPEGVEAMAAAFEEFKAFRKGLGQRLDLLSREYETTALEESLKTLDTQIQQYTLCLKVSRQLAEMIEWVMQDFKLLTRHVINLRMKASAATISEAELFDAQMQSRYEQITTIIHELEPQTRDQFKEMINFSHLDLQRENFHQLLDEARQQLHMPS